VAQPYTPIPPVHPDDAAYQAAAAAEAAHWSDPATISVADALALAPLGPMKRYYNRRCTGSELQAWLDVISQNGPYTRGLILGCGGIVYEERILEANPDVAWTFCDIDPGSLHHRLDRFADRYPGRIQDRQLDFNFAELEPNAYDLIVSAASLHHVVNLEHIAAQINRALTPEGRFYLSDFTGASGFRFPEGQRRVFEVLYERERARRPEAHLPPIAWRNVDDGTYSPFEAVRSADVIAVLARHLREESRRAVGTVIGLLFFAGIAEQYRRPPKKRPSPLDRILRRGAVPAADTIVWEEMLSPACFADLILADELLTDANIFPPNNTFAIYSKA